MQWTRDRLLPLLDKHVVPLLDTRFGPAIALAIAVGVGLIAASLMNLVLEGLFSVQWWTVFAYMAVFFVTGVRTYRRISPRGVRLTREGGKRYLADSGTTDLVAAVKDVRQVFAKTR